MFLRIGFVKAVHRALALARAFVLVDQLSEEGLMRLKGFRGLSLASRQSSTKDVVIRNFEIIGELLTVCQTDSSGNSFAF